MHDDSSNDTNSKYKQLLTCGAGGWIAGNVGWVLWGKERERWTPRSKYPPTFTIYLDLQTQSALQK